MISGVMTATVGILWIIILFIFYCLGRDKVGFLSGEPFHRKMSAEAIKRGSWMLPRSSRVYTSSQASTTTTDSELVEPPPRQPWSMKNRSTRVRITYITCGLLFIIASIILSAKGLSNLHRSATNVQEASLSLDNYFHDAWQTYNSGLNGIGKDSNNSFQSLRNEKQRSYFCPDDPSLRNDSIGMRVHEQIMDSLRHLQALKDLMGSTGHEMERTLAEAASITRTLSLSLESMVIVDWRVLLVSIPYTVIPLLLVIGAAMALSESTSSKYIAVMEYVLAPLFFLMVAVAWGVAAGMAIVAGANGDLCIPGDDVGTSPDEALLSIMEARFDNQSVVAMANWFISQCTTGDNPFTELSVVARELKLGAGKLAILSSALEMPSLSEYCGRDYKELQQLVLRLNEIVVLYSDNALETVDTLSCDRVVPLYVDAVYGNMCSTVPTDLFWIFCGCICLGVFGMIMITTRSSWQKTVFDHTVEAPAISLEDSIGQILAEDELSHATGMSEVSEQLSLRAKIAAFNTVANIDFVKDEEANRADREALGVLPVALASRILDPQFFAANLLPSDGSRTPSHDVSLTSTTVSPASDSDGPVENTANAWRSMRQWNYQPSMHSNSKCLSSNPQSGDQITSKDDTVADPPLLDIDEDSASEASDDEILSREVRVISGQCVDSSCGDDGQEVILSELVVGDSVAESTDLAPSSCRDADQDSAIPFVDFFSNQFGRLPIEDDFFVPDDTDRQVWNSF